MANSVLTKLDDVVGLIPFDDGTKMNVVDSWGRVVELSKQQMLDLIAELQELTNKMVE